MVEIKIEYGIEEYDINLYSNGKFIKRICACYEKDYANMIAISLARQSNALMTDCVGDDE
jgi:hypothetical protein